MASHRQCLAVVPDRDGSILATTALVAEIHARRVEALRRLIADGSIFARAEVRR